VCNWGAECINLKKLLDQASDVLLTLLTRMIPIKCGSNHTSVALRSAVKLHFKLGSRYDDKMELFIAAHHCAPSLISKNYEGSKGNRPSRQFKNLLTRSEAQSYNCSAMTDNVNLFESCMRRAGVLIERADERRLLIMQAPTNPLSNVRSYFQGITGNHAVHLRVRLLEEEKREPLAVPIVVSSASPLRSIPAAVPSSPVHAPDLTPSVCFYQKYIQLKYSETRNSNTKFCQCFKMLQTFYNNFDAIECGTDPKVFFYPCRGDPQFKDCLQYGIHYRQLSMAVFCKSCGQRETKSRRAELQHKNNKLHDTNGKRTAANSATGFTNLSPGKKDARMASLAK
jgi:hypothetical protein